MLSQYSYPIVCSDQFEITVAFYEDYFNYVPAFEMDGFTILKREDRDDMFLAVMDAEHKAIPEQYRKTTAGIILNYPVSDAKLAYQELYWEGLNILSEPEDAVCGRKHFFVEDPNGILIDVAENIDIDSLLGSDKKSDLCMVA